MTDDLLQRLRAAERYPYGTVKDPSVRSNIAREAAAEIERLRAEVARLTGCLKTANSQTEEFERKFYLEQDRATRAESELAALRGRIAAAPVVCIDNGACVTDGARLTIAGGDTYFAHAELCGKRVRLVVNEG